MIWFTCQSCGKVHGRAEASAGALIFCDCGLNLRVPWESTAAAPPVIDAPAIEPIRFEPAQGERRATEMDSELDIAVPKARVRRRGDPPPDANYCLSHPSVPKTTVCAECRQSFCSRCVTSFQGKDFCAPCKNYRTRLLQRRPQSNVLATASLIAGLASAPVLFLFLPAAGRVPSWSLMFVLVPQVIALMSGCFALAWIQKQPGRTGAHLALSGIGLAIVVGALTMMLAVFGHKLVA